MTSPAAAEALARAARSARSGGYEEAHRILDELADGSGGSDGSHDDPAVLDLRARLHAQRGELAEADACWARVQDLASSAAPSPSASVSSSARAGRRRIAALQAGRYGMSTGRRLAVGGLLLAAGAAVAGAVVAPLTSGSPASDADVAAVRDRQTGLTERLDELRDGLAARTPSPASSPPEPEDGAAELDGPGTTVARQGNKLLITFDKGLFAKEAAMTPGGASALTDLARRLGRADLRGPVVVTGHTDDAPLPDGSPYTDRVNLGFARAETAAEELADDSGIPLPSIGIRSTGTASPPFPGNSPADRARNNTVTVLVGPVA